MDFHPTRIGRRRKTCQVPVSIIEVDQWIMGCFLRIPYFFSWFLLLGIAK